MSHVPVVMAYALRESLRRRVFAVVVALTVVFLGLYAWGANVAFDEVTNFADRRNPVDAKTITGSTVFGLSMFTTPSS